MSRSGAARWISTERKDPAPVYLMALNPRVTDARLLEKHTPGRKGILSTDLTLQGRETASEYVTALENLGVFAKGKKNQVYITTNPDRRDGDVSYVFIPVHALDSKKLYREAAKAASNNFAALRRLKDSLRNADDITGPNQNGLYAAFSCAAEGNAKDELLRALQIVTVGDSLETRKQDEVLTVNVPLYRLDAGFLEKHHTQSPAAPTSLTLHKS